MVGEDPGRRGCLAGGGDDVVFDRYCFAFQCALNIC